jgi:GAF domain-containing protein
MSFRYFISGSLTLVSVCIVPDRVIALPFRPTLTTKALDLSSLGWFEICPYRPIPRGLLSSLIQHGYLQNEGSVVTHHPALIVIAYLVAALLIAGMLAIVVRFWRGDRLEAGFITIERSEAVRTLQSSVDEISRDDRLKKNILWAFRERLNEANKIISDGIETRAVHHWCGGILTDTVTALSEGGHDRHRASLWVRRGDRLRMYVGLGFRQEAVDNARLPLTSIAGNVLQTGATYTSADVEGDKSFFPKPRSGPGYRSLLAVPVKTPYGRPIATLCVDAEAQGYFDSDHEFFAGCFADLVALLVAQVVIGDEP